jgi:hypothetical protein
MKKTGVFIGIDEYYPFYFISDEGDKLLLSKKKLEWVRKGMKNFGKVQSFLSNEIDKQYIRNQPDEIEVKVHTGHGNIETRRIKNPLKTDK